VISYLLLRYKIISLPMAPERTGQFWSFPGLLRRTGAGGTYHVDQPVCAQICSETTVKRTPQDNLAWPMGADLVVFVVPAGHRDTRKFTGSRFTVLTRIARLPGATSNHRRRARQSGPKLDGNRRVGILGERTQRGPAIGA
jgi:hypothetical protein